ncbi:MAG: hypothetical protein ACE5J9_05430 [Methanosarcinales archaeon]
MKKVILGILVSLVVLSTLSIASAYYPERAGTVGYWHFEEGSGNVAVDSSGLGNNGTIYGATWTTGKVGGALSFDGVDDYVEVPDSVSLDISGNQITDYQRIVVKEIVNNRERI